MRQRPNATGSALAPPGSLTYEQIADRIGGELHRRGWVATAGRTPWDAFGRLSELVHGSFQVPATSFTPMMRRLLFALAVAARPRLLVGVGTYVGYTFSWLLGDHGDTETGPLFGRAEGFDTDRRATRLAQVNCQALRAGDALRFEATDGARALSRSGEGIDLLYIDIDSPITGKAAYVDIVDAARPRLRPGALVLAHDPCVPRFALDFVRYHRYLAGSGAFDGPLVLPVDACGLSVAVARGAASGDTRAGHGAAAGTAAGAVP